MSRRSAATMAGQVAGAFRQAAVQLRAQRGAGLSFYEFLLSPDYAAPYFQASGVEPSPIVLAIAQASEGLPVTTIDDATALEVFGCGLDALPREPRRTVVVSAGRGGGKTSSLLTPAAVHAMWTVPLPHLKPNERARATVIAPLLEQAEQAYRYALGLIDASPVLRAHLHEDTNTEQIVLRRPDGREVEFVVSAAHKGGGTARSRSLIFAGLDEGAHLQGEGFAVNDKAIYDAALGSMIGREIDGQVWLVSSPWVEHEGLMEEIVDADHGKHTRALVAARVSTYMLKGIPDDGHLAEEGMDDDAYRREILAIPLPAGSKVFFPPTDLLRAAEKRAPIGAPAELGAGVDLAHTNDFSAMVNSSRHIGGIFAPRLVREVQSAPGQKPSDTYKSFAASMYEAGIRRFAADVHCKPNIREHTDAKGILFVDAPEFIAPWLAARRLLQEERIVLGELPAVIRDRLITQLRSVLAVERRDRPGHIRLILPRKKGQGHADAAAAFVLSLWMCGSDDPSRWDRSVDKPRTWAAPPARNGPTRRRPPTRKRELNRYVKGAGPPVG